MSSASPRTATCGSAAATKAFGSPTTGVIEWTEDGIPYGRPEIVLLFKAKHAHRDRDQSDFEAVVPRLEPERRRWLAEALEQVHPGHPWLDRLT